MLLVHRLLALGAPAPDGGLVHDVVVVQRREVGQLADDRRPDHLRRLRVAQLGGEQREHRPEPLARRPTSGGRPPRGRTGARCPTASVSADSTRTRPSASDAPSAPSGSQGPIVDAGVETRCHDRRPRSSALDCGTGSGHQPTKIAACSARSSTAPGTMPSTRVAVGGDRQDDRRRQARHADRRAVGGRRREVHQHDDPQVEERRHRAGQQRDQHQRPRPRLDRRPEHRELGGEAGGERDAGQRQEEQAHHRGGQRRPARPAPPTATGGWPRRRRRAPG